MLAGVCLINALYSQITFERTHGQPAAYDEANPIVLSGDGQIYTLGSRFNYDNGSLDFLLSKLNAQGNELWPFTYGGGKNEEGRSCTICRGAGFRTALSKSWRK